MKNGDQPAYPLQPTFDSDGRICNERFSFEGLTKREYFAAMAMQGMIASGWVDSPTFNEMVRRSIIAADELLKQLEK